MIAQCDVVSLHYADGRAARSGSGDRSMTRDLRSLLPIARTGGEHARKARRPFDRVVLGELMPPRYRRRYGPTYLDGMMARSLARARRRAERKEHALQISPPDAD